MRARQELCAWAMYKCLSASFHVRSKISSQEDLRSGQKFTNNISSKIELVINKAVKSNIWKRLPL
jgi:hypothetical protein